ncbi:hypothetical protein N7456_011313 [Penicillium angulare]|uniref:Uncharacterized protein n=1 Tax=Penicillium angulare TaxID=116970 RepID=A0A9W9ETD6_9EURO|nr:hypothetical protein N7456_011313 [Penicillium angulare]
MIFQRLNLAIVRMAPFTQTVFMGTVVFHMYISEKQFRANKATITTLQTDLAQQDSRVAEIEKILQKMEK